MNAIVSLLGLKGVALIAGVLLSISGLATGYHFIAKSAAYNDGYQAGYTAANAEHAEAERKALLSKLAKRSEADDKLGEQEAARLEVIRQQVAKDDHDLAQLRSDQNQDRNAFTQSQIVANAALKRELESLADKEPKVVTQYVEKIINKCPYAGDSRSSAGFMRKYNGLLTGSKTGPPK